MHVLLFSFFTLLGLSLLLFSFVTAVVSLATSYRLVLFCRNLLNFNTLVIQCNHSEENTHMLKETMFYFLSFSSQW